MPTAHRSVRLEIELHPLGAPTPSEFVIASPTVILLPSVLVLGQIELSFLTRPNAHILRAELLFGRRIHWLKNLYGHRHRDRNLFLLASFFTEPPRQPRQELEP